ncbi:MAG: GNAT family N-acetyltransferase [Eggerthellaceae bacterium]
MLEHHGATEYDGVDWNVAAAIDEYSVIHLLCSLPRFQGKGIGRALLRATRYRTQERKTLCAPGHPARQYTSAQNLYESEGFVRIGEATLHYPDGSFDSVLFELPLN